MSSLDNGTETLEAVHDSVPSEDVEMAAAILGSLRQIHPVRFTNAGPRSRGSVVLNTMLGSGDFFLFLRTLYTVLVGLEEMDLNGARGPFNAWCVALRGHTRNFFDAFNELIDCYLTMELNYQEFVDLLELIDLHDPEIDALRSTHAGNHGINILTNFAFHCEYSLRQILRALHFYAYNYNDEFVNIIDCRVFHNLNVRRISSTRYNNRI